MRAMKSCDRSSAVAAPSGEAPVSVTSATIFTEAGAFLTASNGAAPLDVSDPLVALRDAGKVLGLPPAATTTDTLQHLVQAWQRRWPLE